MTNAVIDIPVGDRVYGFTALFMGRTALTAAVQDILGKRSIATVWVPDYCCSSVIYPFTDLGCTDIAFYHVGLSPHGFSLELSDFCPRRGDVIYYCDYYWFDARLYEAILAKRNGATLIHDRTHSLLDPALSIDADDYEIVSIRKWFALTQGGLLYAKEPFIVPLQPTTSYYSRLKARSRYFRDLYRTNGNPENFRLYREYSDKADREAESRYAGLPMRDEELQFLLEVDWEALRREKEEFSGRILRSLSDLGLDMSFSAVFTPRFSIPCFCEDSEALLERLQSHRGKCARFWDLFEDFDSPLSKTNVSIEISAYNCRRLEAWEEPS